MVSPQTQDFPRNGNGTHHGQYELIPTSSIPLPMGASTNSASDASQSVDLRGLLSAFRRRWLLATVLGVVLGAAAGAMAWFLLPAPYSTFAEFHISSVSDQLLPGGSGNNRASFSTWKQTQMKLLTNPFVLNAALRDPAVGQASVLRDEPRPVDWLERNLQVSQSGAEFFRLSLEGENPDEITKIVNAVSKAFEEEVVNKDANRRKDQLDNLKKVHRESEDKLRSRHRALESYARQLESNPSHVDEKQGFLLTMQVEMSRALADLHLELMKAELLAAQHEKATEQVDSTIPEAILNAEIAQQPEYQRLQQRLATQRFLVKRSESLTENHPRRLEAEATLQELEDEKSALRERLRPKVEADFQTQLASNVEHSASSLGTQIEYMRSQKAELEKRLEEIEIEERDTAKYSLELDQLNKEISREEKFAEQVASEIRRLEFEERYAPTDISLTRKAEIPYQRETKKKVMMAGAAGFGLCGLLMASIVFFEYQSRRIHSVEEVTGELKLRLVGAVPALPRDIVRGKSRRNVARTAYWSNALTEAIDSTRTMVLREARDRSFQCLMVGSAVGGEGKTTLACHLATSVARSGRRVLLVDGDIRRPSAHKVFGVEQGPGLCELLRGEISLDEAVVPTTAAPGLTLLPAGKLDAEAVQLLAQDRLREVIDALRTAYDFIVFDSSPILPVTDGLLLGQHVDGVVLAVRRDVSRLKKVGEVFERLNMLGVPVIGAVGIGMVGAAYNYRSGYGREYRYFRSSPFQDS